MLKLPKGLKKKKKGKKSKKNQELFTEEELEAYKREQREKQEAAAAGTDHQQEQDGAFATTFSSTSGDCASNYTGNNTTGDSAAAAGGKGLPKEDDEWSKFKALTTGIDSALKKTQGDLDRIKESSFYQRVPTTTEKKVIEVKKRATENKERDNSAGVGVATTATASSSVTVAHEKQIVTEQKSEADYLADAVIELSESEEESDDADDIFDTAYIDTLTSGDVQLAYVPESPTEDFDEGPDPFDTSYADKVIKGPEVSKRGKKLVNIGSAVEVLTGRVEKVSSTLSSSRRPRRGPQNLLLESFDEGTNLAGGNDSESYLPVPDSPIKTLLDDFGGDDIPDVPIDLSVSLHIQFQKEKLEQEASLAEQAVSEFDSFVDENDEFAELAAESLTKKEDKHILTEVSTVNEHTSEFSSSWAAEFEQSKEPAKGKPPTRPPPPRAVVQTEPVVGAVINGDEFDIDLGDDPFDTTFADRVLPEPEDIDFDPRKDEESVSAVKVISPIYEQKSKTISKPIDLLSENNPELETVVVDPFDTTSISVLVKTKPTIIDNKLNHSLSDPDFDPRAEEVITVSTPSEADYKTDYDIKARRKSSLSLNIAGGSALKTVGFSTSDLLGVNNTNTGKIQKPLTPYYSQQIVEEKEAEDPFDTSFVSENQHSQIELHLLERELLSESHSTLKKSLSDPDFDPRAESPIKPPSATTSTLVNQAKSDLLGVNEDHNIKVLTPALHENRFIAESSFDSYVDPFDTSAIDQNILPGKTELKLLENELLPAVAESSGRLNVLDSSSDAQDLGLGDKVLTPQNFLVGSDSIEEDPFDTSIANNLGPGKAEIRVLESELIHQ